MVRIPTPPGPAARGRRDELRLREVDRSNRRIADMIGAATLTARHAWTGSGNIIANTEIALNLAGHWAVKRDDGVAVFAPQDGYVVPGFYLNRPGRWMIMLTVQSDATFSGVMRATLHHAVDESVTDLFDGTGALRDTRPRLTGYPQAGTIEQPLSWTGPVTADEAAYPLQVSLRHACAPGAGMAASSWRLQVNYLGEATEAGEVIAPEPTVPQDDAAAGTTPESPAAADTTT